MSNVVEFPQRKAEPGIETDPEAVHSELVWFNMKKANKIIEAAVERKQEKGAGWFYQLLGIYLSGLPRTMSFEEWLIDRKHIQPKGGEKANG